MADTPTDIKAQKASLLADASLDHENKVGVENQINDDAGKSLGASLKDFVESKVTGSNASEGLPTSTGTATTGNIPLGADAIKAAGPQAQRQGYPYGKH